MNEYDTDEDGSLDLIEFTKFVQKMIKKKSKMKNLMSFKGATAKKKVSVNKHDFLVYFACRVWSCF